MPKFYADLHCHPTMYSFNRMRNVPKYENEPSTFHAWNIMPSDLQHMDAGRRASDYSQSGFDKCHKVGMRLLFLSFTPIERGFFQGNKGAQETPFITEAAKLLSGLTALNSVQSLLSEGPKAAAERITGVLKNRGPLRQIVQAIVMKYDPRHINFLAGPKYDYWEEFLKEYDFLKRANGTLHDTVVSYVDEGQETYENIQGRYWLATSAPQVKSTLEDSETDLSLILTIEGGHVFSIAPDESTLPKSTIMERIDQLKTLPHPILFITIAHHFDNGFVGHAHSILDSANLIMDQEPRMHEGFERRNDLGLSIVRHLLDVDEDLKPQGNRRILIDCKHLSAVARREYYEEIIEPYHEAQDSLPKKKRGLTIPVLFSHASYSNVQTLDELIEFSDQEDDHTHRGSFYSWNINVCDDDVRMVHKTGGLIGLVFDQRVAGVKPREKVKKIYWPDVILRHIFAMVDVILQDERIPWEERLTVWDCIGLGTDFDGFIDPVTCYPTVLEIPQFEEDLRQALQSQSHTRGIEKIGVEAIVDKICMQNLYDFALKYMPKS